jgi:hypothetical protein
VRSWCLVVQAVLLQALLPSTLGQQPYLLAPQTPCWQPAVPMPHAGSAQGQSLGGHTSCRV